MVLRSLPLPHTFYKSMYLEVVAVLHYNNHDGVIHACVLKTCVRDDHYPVCRLDIRQDSEFATRPVTSWGHQQGRRVFREGPKFFELCPMFLNYAQHIFPGGRKIF